MPIGLLSPWFLLAGLAVILPILIHLLQRRREVVLPYSMVRFVLLARRRSSRRLRLRRLFLLALRVLIILLVALILARPVIYSPAAVFREKVPGYTAVVLDNSLSMSVQTGGGSRFEAARALTADVISQAGESERFFLIEAAGREGSAGGRTWQSREQFLTALSRSEVRPAVADFSAALGKAYALFQETSTREKKILVVTDLARGGWEDFSLVSISGVDPAVPVGLFWLDDDGGVNRTGILDVSLRGESRVAGEAVEVLAKLANYGAKGAVPVELWLDGDFQDRRVADIPFGQTGEIAFTVRLERGGARRGEVRLSPDRFREDDSRLFGLSVSPSVSVLLIDGDPYLSLMESETFFLQEALRPERLSSIAPIEVTVSGPDEIRRLAWSRFDLVMMANLETLSPETAQSLTEFVAGGGGLVIFWGDNCRPEAYQRLLAGLLPATVRGNETALDEQPYRIGRIDYADEMFALFIPPDGGTFATASFRRRAEVGPAVPGAKILASFADGRPWVLERPVRRGRVIFFASTADLAWNDLATKPVYVPLIQRAVLSLSGNLVASGGSDVNVDDEKVISGRSDQAYSRVTVKTPAGEVREVEFLPGDDGVQAVFKESSQVGFYTYAMPGREGIFAVNVPPQESDLRPLAAEDIRTRFQQTSLNLIPVGEGTLAGDFSQGGVRSLARPLMIALFFLGVLEMLVAGPRRRLMGKGMADSPGGIAG